MKQELKSVDNKNIATPADLIAMAVQQGADIDKLEKLMQLQERYDANEAKKAFIAARSAFSGESIKILKKSKGHNSKYAKLGDELEVVSPLLSKHGLSHSWITSQENNAIIVTCVLTHIQGHSESTALSSTPETSGSKNAIQAIGSAVSYLKRYTFEAICGLASVDDDGQATSQETYPTEEKVDYGKVNAAANFFKGIIDKDDIEQHLLVKAAYEKLNNNETMALNSRTLMGEKPEGSRKKYKSILKDYLDHVPE